MTNSEFYRTAQDAEDQIMEALLGRSKKSKAMLEGSQKGSLQRVGTLDREELS
jgi:hypothetical protein